MEKNSTGDLISALEESNQKNFEIEEIDLKLVDRELDGNEREAQRRYDEFETDQLKRGDEIKWKNKPQERCLQNAERLTAGVVKWKELARLYWNGYPPIMKKD